MALSIVSRGTEASLAFWNMVRRVGLASRSPPPSRAATSTCRISLANSLPRALSKAPFLCLVVAHLECPDIFLPLGEALQEPLVQARVARQLGVERAHQHRALPAQYRPAVHPGQHFDLGARPFHDGGADEDRVQGASQAAHLQVGLERLPLAPKSVAAHGDVDGTEV